MTKRPNIVFVLTDDHAAHSVGCYGSVVNETPRIDEIADLWSFSMHEMGVRPKF